MTLWPWVRLVHRLPEVHYRRLSMNSERRARCQKCDLVMRTDAGALRVMRHPLSTRDATDGAQLQDHTHVLLYNSGDVAL